MVCFSSEWLICFLCVTVGLLRLHTSGYYKHPLKLNDHLFTKEINGCWKFLPVCNPSNCCCVCSRCSSTETSWTTTTRSLTPTSFLLSLTEKLPSTTARPQQPSCSTKPSPSLCQRGWEPLYITNPIVCGDSNPKSSCVVVDQTGTRQSHFLSVISTLYCIL